MNEDQAFVSTLGSIISRYLGLQRALGRRYAVERGVLQSLDRFLKSESADLTEDSFTRWSRSQENLTRGVRRNRMRIVRNLCLYRRRSTPTCFVPDLLLFPAPHSAAPPYIFTEAQISRLVRETDTLQRVPESPLRPELFRFAITLLYTTGLRRGELLNLTTGDYDPRERTLLVREGKFHKSRLLPLSADGTLALEEHLQIRHSQRLPVSAETPLIWNGRLGGKAYTGVGFGNVLRDLFRRVGIRRPNGAPPRVHDFRHTFACHALLRWYRNGEDVQAKLPMLATYMGHVSIASTQHYLHLIETISNAANERFARHCAGLITAPTAALGGER